jgi:hypothetical protein
MRPGARVAEVGEAIPAVLKFDDPNDPDAFVIQSTYVQAPPSPYTLGIVAVAAVGLFWMFWGRR